MLRACVVCAVRSRQYTSSCCIQSPMRTATLQRQRRPQGGVPFAHKGWCLAEMITQVHRAHFAPRTPILCLHAYNSSTSNGNHPQTAAGRRSVARHHARSNATARRARACSSGKGTRHGTVCSVVTISGRRPALRGAAANGRHNAIAAHYGNALAALRLSARRSYVAYTASTVRLPSGVCRLQRGGSSSLSFAVAAGREMPARRYTAAAPQTQTAGHNGVNRNGNEPYARWR